MVEWKKLGEVCEVLRGKRLTKSQLNEHEGYPVLHGGSTPMGYYKEFNRKANTTVVVNTGNAGSVFFYDKEFWSSDACFSLYPNETIIDKFLYLYVYGCERILKGKIRAGAMPTIDANAIENLVIPIPSLIVQQRIVEQLDTFTSSIENLKEQISQRRKQYEYYRDQLFDLEGKEGVERKKLGDICYNLDYMRKPITSSKRKGGIFPYYGASGIVDYVEGYIFDGDYLLVSEDGANLVTRTYPIAFSIKGKNWVNNHAHVLAFDSQITQKYVKIYLNMIDLSPWINGAAQPKLNQANLNTIDIPVPPLSAQQRIVSILDTFEASINNLEQQLAQREKQYEYYRNKLLNFN